MSQSMNAVAGQRRPGMARWVTALCVVAAICAVSVFQLRREAAHRDAAHPSDPQRTAPEQ